MTEGSLITPLFWDHTLRTVALGAAVLGFLSGTLGSYAVLRKQSLLGDAVSHAALPGIAVAFLLTGARSSLAFMIGAALAGWLATLFVMLVVRSSRVKEDAALGLVLSVFFGVGLVMLTFIQRQPGARQAGLDRFLFGQAAALLEEHVVTMLVVTLGALLLVGALWKELKLLSFDREFGATLGMPMGLLDALLTGLLVVAIVVGLQTVGVVLMSAMLVAPAAGARQWTDRLSRMVLLAGLFGALAGAGGAVVSATSTGLPTGPIVVLMATGVALFSLLFAPNRGVVWAWARELRNRRRVQGERVLLDLLALARQHGDPSHGHGQEVLRAMSNVPAAVGRTLTTLREAGLVTETTRSWRLTEEGLARAQALEAGLAGRES